MARLPSISVLTTRPAAADVDVLVLTVVGKKGFDDSVSDALAKSVIGASKKRTFTVAWGTAVLIPASQLASTRGLKAPFVAVIGLGDSDSTDKKAEGLRRGLGKLVKDVSALGLREIGISLAGRKELVAAAVESLALTTYQFTEHSKRLAKQPGVNKCYLLVDKDDQSEVRKALAEARSVARGVSLARDLVNQPAGHMKPSDLVASARVISEQSDNITVKVRNRAQVEKDGWTAFLAVAQGSVEEPYVIHLTYKPKEQTEDTKKIFLVGKGITFDSGGLSIKPAQYMEDMKMDMGGAATVLGVFDALSRLGVPHEVHGVIATCENMPSGTAYRPGDVVTAKNGKTIEVLNTDAEGRVTLADALSYAAEYKPDAIIDVATLTGAAVVSLGETVAGLWGSDKDLMESLGQAANAAGEGVEDMPMPQEYRTQLDSTVADLRNIATGNYGGAITAAMFLREFVGKVPWAHLDIAGPAYMTSNILSYYGKGATGFGVRTIVKYLQKIN